MAALDFPTSPSVGQAYTANGSTWVWNGVSWTTKNADTPYGGGGDKTFYLNDQVVTTSYTIPANQNAMSAGPITINSGAVVTVSAGSVWTVV